MLKARMGTKEQLSDWEWDFSLTALSRLHSGWFQDKNKNTVIRNTQYSEHELKGWKGK